MSTSKTIILLLLSLSTCPCVLAGMVKANVIEAYGDFNGDSIIDSARGFPEANEGKGRVDIHWGQSSYIPTNPTVISQIMYPTSTLRSGSLGAALATGDFNGDGSDDLAIGAPDSADAGHFAGGGSVHVIFGCRGCNSLDANGGGLPANVSPLNPLAASTWHQTQSSPSFNDRPRLGFALASGDFNNDGFDDLAMAQPFDTFSGKNEAGRVLVRYGSRTGLRSVLTQFHQSVIGDSYSLENLDHFGWDLAAANLDGRNGDELVVGTPGEDWGGLTDPGEATVFWSGERTAGLSADSTTRIRMSTDWVGSTRTKQRFGEELIARTNPSPGANSTWQGLIKGGLATSSSCDIAAIELTVEQNREIARPASGFICGVDFCNTGNSIAHGQLPTVPVHFTEIARPASTGGTVAQASQLPGSWAGTHPITGNSLTGPLSYFFAMTDLINQQMVTNSGRPICDGNDCLKFVYGGRSSLSQISKLCPELANLSQPTVRLTENCNGNCAPRPLSPDDNASDLSTYAHEAILVCINRGGLPADALNIVIYDNCREVDGSVECTGGRGGNRNGRARSGLDKYTGERRYGGLGSPHHPGIYVDWERAVQPRLPGVSDVSAAEEHEIGHAFGLHHRVMCSRSSLSPTMYSSDIVSETGRNEQGTTDIPVACASRRTREQGFSECPGYDFYDRNIVEVDQLIEVARQHHKELWTCPSN